MKKKPRAPRVPLSHLSTTDLLRGFDNALQDWTGFDDDLPPFQEPVLIGHHTYPIGDVLEQILAWGNCHGDLVQADTSRALRELLGKHAWPYHSEYAPGTYKQAAQAVLTDLQACEAQWYQEQDS